jgi:hypothetical protein
MNKQPSHNVNTCKCCHKQTATVEYRAPFCKCSVSFCPSCLEIHLGVENLVAAKVQRARGTHEDSNGERA